MASYLLFYLNLGKVQGTQIIPAHLFNRLEVSTSTWAAKEGLHVGYGLGNYWSIHDGFVYHGHDGNVPGGLTVMSYMPKEGVGYFYSINSENREALRRINTIIRAYITRNLQKPAVPPTVSLSEKVNIYTGWYEPNSPRMELSFFSNTVDAVEKPSQIRISLPSSRIPNAKKHPECLLMKCLSLGF